MNFKIICMVTVLIAIGHVNSSKRADIKEDRKFWMELGQETLKNVLSTKFNENVAKNVIFFLGDGMSLATVNAARILKGQREGRTGEEGYLDFETFPYSGLLKTYCVDDQVCDSAPTATALLTGVKTNHRVVGADATVSNDDCSSLTEDASLSGIASWSQEMGKRTGILTTSGVTHASPAAVYAHSASRDWECDADLDDTIRDTCPEFKDIARQLIEDEPGRNFNVIMGGGLSFLDGDAIETPTDGKGSCLRQDGRNLWEEWLENPLRRDNSYFVKTKSELMALNLKKTENIMGIFANGHMHYEYEKRDEHLDVPTLSEMVEAAITVLDTRNKDGYFLFVESARIDTGHHGNRPQVALDETIELSNAVGLAVNLTSSKDTLIIVTADHSHTMSFSGYQRRGNDILGVAGLDDNDVAYTTLQYINGPGYKFYAEDGVVKRSDPRNDDLTDMETKYQSKDIMSSETHGGDDVPIYATGPMAHLFQGVMEQNFVAHAMAYASCVGPNLDHCSKQ